MREGDPVIEARNKNAPKLIQLVIKYSGGLITNDKQATYVLIGFIVAATAISLSLIFGGRGNTSFNLEDYPYGIVSPDET